MDDDLIRRGDALRLVEDYETIHDRISMLPRADLAQAPAPVRVRDVEIARLAREIGEIGRDLGWHRIYDRADAILAALDTPYAGVVAELVEALQPFAFADEEYDDIPDHQGVMLTKTDDSETLNLVFMSDLRRARAVLAKVVK